MERIHRQGVSDRIGEVSNAGTFGESVNLGYRGEINWIDIWGPTFTCPTMEHIGIIGDGGKWVCGVNELLQRPGCVIYSLGSFNEYSFEQAMLERTPCEVHVFDPTVLPSQMREREALLNGDGPTRIKWHSVGISDVDTDESSLLQCFGGSKLPGYSASGGRKLQFGWFTKYVDKRWRPEETIVQQDLAAAAAGATPAAPPAPIDPRAQPVQTAVDGLRASRDRILGSAARCGPEARLPRGIAPLPPATDAGALLGDMDVTPHGDAQTMCRMATLPSIMKTLGHDWVDVLKMDIEGSEYAALGHLATLPGDAMRFTQLQLEVHHGWSTSDPGMPNVAQFTLLRGLLEHNYRTALLEPNIYTAGQTCHELAMLKVDACGNVITPDPGPPANAIAAVAAPGAAAAAAMVATPAATPGPAPTPAPMPAPTPARTPAPTPAPAPANSTAATPATTPAPSPAPAPAPVPAAFPNGTIPVSAPQASGTPAAV